MKLLIDSDFLFALFKPDDSNNDRAKKLLKKYLDEDLSISNLVLQESTTLVSKRMGMKYAIKFYASVTQIVKKIIYLDLHSEKDAWELFLSQTKKGSSFIDCSNMTIYKKFKFDNILAFDEYYPKNVRITSE
ncbi:MAG: hypothetical protein ACD_19C00182G0088 [uncultured bacterium]|nr:MAG: hypothetical protein ACD_19C00182G0088 [uncultured bacterium]